MKRVLIIGGGITGLSAAWFLKKKHPGAHITLFEKENQLGGWIRSSNEGGFFFEKGPRTFQKGRSPHLLALIDELKLETITSNPFAAKRFILHRGKLRTPQSFLPFWAFSLLKEFFIPRGTKQDESIYEFAARRFSPKIAETLFDPLTLGIYAGDIRKLSMRSGFPTLYQWEQEKGSVLKGFLTAPKKERGLFTVKGGMEELIHALKKNLQIEILLNCPAKVRGNEVFANGKLWWADQIISALPLALPKRSIWVVNLAFQGDVLLKKGFGYLIPSQEKESVLGVVFDSVIFPEQNRGNETRLTAMIREEEREPLKAALSALRRHLRIEEEPIFSSCFLAKEAIAQMEVGCGFTGNISVEGCIQRAMSLS
jgi:oxygen-dependent protoporphyrinogen oxidase